MTAYTPRHAFSVPRQLPELQGGEPVSPAVAAFRFFRRLVRQWRRKPAAPAEFPAAGTAAPRPATQLLKPSRTWYLPPPGPLPRRVPGASLVITPLPIEAGPVQP